MSLRQQLLKRLRRFLAPAYHAVYRSLLPARWWFADHFHGPAPRKFPIPPAKLRFRVGESTDMSLFLAVGEQAANNIQANLAGVGHSINQFGSILDFGCGCGRTLIWLAEAFPELRWHGIDIDAEAMAWCQEHIPKATFSVNSPLPPLAFPDEAFGLVYAISVFTHLSAEHQKAWLPELHRILKPGGLRLLTFYSEHVWKPLDIAQEVANRGFVFRTSAKLKGVVPDWYHTAFQTPSHIIDLLSGTHFSVVKVCMRGFGDHDVIIAKRE